MAKVTMPDYPDNSDIKKEESKPVTVREEEHAGAGAILRKKSTARKISDSILPKSDRKEIADYLVHDVALPALKETLSDIVSNGVNMMLFGDTRSSKSSVRGNDKYKRDYGSNKYSRGHSVRPDSRRRRELDLDDIIFPNRGAALRAYDNLLDILDEYHWVKVKDLFNEAELTPDWTGDAYGWDELPARAEVERIKYRDDEGDIEYGYVLILPSPMREERR